LVVEDRLGDRDEDRAAESLDEDNDGGTFCYLAVGQDGLYGDLRAQSV